MRKFGPPVPSKNPILTQLLMNEVPYDHPARELYGATGHKECLMPENDLAEERTQPTVFVRVIVPSTTQIMMPGEPARPDWPHPKAKPLNKLFELVNITEVR
jgi:hypothetical protein